MNQKKVKTKTRLKHLYIVTLNTLKAYIEKGNSAFNIKLCSNKKGYPLQDNLLFELYLGYMIYLLLIYEATQFKHLGIVAYHHHWSRPIYLEGHGQPWHTQMYQTKRFQRFQSCR